MQVEACCEKFAAAAKTIPNDARSVMDIAQREAEGSPSRQKVGFLDRVECEI